MPIYTEKIIRAAQCIQTWSFFARTATLCIIKINTYTQKMNSRDPRHNQNEYRTKTKQAQGRRNGAEHVFIEALSIHRCTDTLN